MARPRKQIDQAIVERLANRQASNPMIAAVVGCSRRTLNRRFGRHLPLWREAGKTRIIDKQWEAMERGNIVMAIFLGKQYLEQADKQQLTVETSEVPYDPIALFASNPELRDRMLQQERDVADAQAIAATAQAALTLNAGTPGVSRLAVPEAPPSSRNGGNGTADKSRPE